MRQKMLELDKASLQQILRYAIDTNSSNSIAFCLGKSRQAMPTDLSVQLNLEIILNSNDIRWIEVLDRQAINNYQLVFYVCKDVFMLYPTLLENNYPGQNQMEFAHLQNNVLNSFTQPNQLNLSPQIKWNAFAALVKAYTRMETFNFTDIQRFFGNLNNLFSNQNILLEFQTWKQYQKTSEEHVDDSIYFITFLEVISLLAKLYKKYSVFTRKKMQYLKFKNSNKNLLLWISNCYTQIFGSCSSIIKSPYQKVFYKTPIKYKIIEDMINCLLQLRQFPQMNCLTMKSYPFLVQTLLNNNLINIDARHNIDIQEHLSWQYSLIEGHFGQEMPSFITKLTLSLCQSPGFMKNYLKNLHQAYTGKLIQQNQAIIKLSIINRSVSLRKDVVYNQVQPLLNLFIQNFTDNYDSFEAQMSFSRKLRLLFLFFEYLKDSQIKTLMKYLYKMLKNEQYSSFCFKEACKMMQKLQEIQKIQNYKNKNISVLVKSIKEQSKTIIAELLNILNDFYNPQQKIIHSIYRQGKLIQIYTIIENVIDVNEAEVQDLFPNLTVKFIDFIMVQFQDFWNRGVKTSHILQMMIRIIKRLIQGIKEDYYVDLSQSIYKLLQLIKYPQALVFQQQFLGILIFVLNSQQSVNAITCQILLSLRSITQLYKGNIYHIRSVLKILCKEKISQSIISEWSDLSIFLLDLFLLYINDVNCKVNSQYILLYHQQWVEMINVFGLFLQTYDEILQDKKYKILSVINQINDSQIRLQLTIILHFKRNIKINEICNASNIIIELKSRKTFKLIIFYYCNMIQYEYDQLIMNQLIQCHRIFKEKKNRNQLSVQMSCVQWPYICGNIESRTSDVVRKIKRLKIIDDFEFNEIMKQLSLN